MKWVFYVTKVPKIIIPVLPTTVTQIDENMSQFRGIHCRLKNAGKLCDNCQKLVI